MNTETFIRQHIRKIILEQETSATPQTRGLGGGLKKDLRGLKALADTNPGELMSRLGVSALNTKDQETAVEDLLSQAISNTDEMNAAYNNPQSLIDDYNRKGVAITLSGEASKEMSVRDSAIFIKHAIRAARSSGRIPAGTLIQVELLGDKILVYSSNKKYTWGMPKAVKKSPPKEKKSSDSLIGVTKSSAPSKNNKK